jgi:hypothetical protein
MKSHRPLLAALSAALLIVLPALVLPTRAWADADSDLDKAAASKDKEAIKHALAAATGSGDAKAAASILRVVYKLRDCDVHHELLEAIQGIKDEGGVAKLADAARHHEKPDVRYVLVEGLALQGSANAAKAVLDALDDKDDTVQVIAARSARLIASGESIEKLIARLEKAEKNPREASLGRELNGALAVLTGEGLSFALEWKGWWMSHKDSWKQPGPPGSGNPPAGSPPVAGKPGDPKPAEPAGRQPAGAEPSGGGDTVMRRIAKDRPADAHTIEHMAQDDVICVKGSSDKVEDVLKAIGVKHTVIQKDKFADQKLDPKSVLVINCDGKGHPAFDDTQIARIREFVDKGGYLFTSDWELQYTIEKAFPGSIAFAGKSSKDMKDEFKVDIHTTREDGKHPFLRDVFPLTTWDAASLTWTMDGWSFLIKVESPDVHVLIASDELKKRFPETPAVAVCFNWKNGKVVKPRTATGKADGQSATAQGGCVLHVLSHFKHQKDPNAGDKFALQQLLLNFFLEKQAANKLK